MKRDVFYFMTIYFILSIMIFFMFALRNDIKKTLKYQERLADGMIDMIDAQLPYPVR